jgi:hydrogenase expression/formation protein HypD
MKYLQEYRDSNQIQGLLRKIDKITTKPWVIMEICGGQTHAIMHYGLEQLLPKEIELIHGPGCPVCVTSLELIDKATILASLKNVIFTTYGDMLRVPGSNGDLFSVRAKGGDIRVVYSPLDAVEIARNNPGKEIVFFAIGFETTAPANAMSVLKAETLGINNFNLLVSQVRVPPAIKLLLSSPYSRVQGFLAAGHVCTVMGYHEYIGLSDTFNIPIVVTGFEPLDILNGIYHCINQLEFGVAKTENAYTRLVTQAGNQNAQEIINQVFTNCDRQWRGIGLIKDSGWSLRPKYADYDAEIKFSVGGQVTNESGECISGEILQGLKKPFECPAFRKLCTPESPLGATMVSSEGACAAYYKYWNN